MERCTVFVSKRSKINLAAGAPVCLLSLIWTLNFVQYICLFGTHDLQKNKGTEVRSNKYLCFKIFPNKTYLESETNLECDSTRNCNRFLPELPEELMRWRTNTDLTLYGSRTPSLAPNRKNKFFRFVKDGLFIVQHHKPSFLSFIISSQSAQTHACQNKKEKNEWGKITSSQYKNYFLMTFFSCRTHSIAVSLAKLWTFIWGGKHIFFVQIHFSQLSSAKVFQYKLSRNIKIGTHDYLIWNKRNFKKLAT